MLFIILNIIGIFASLNHSPHDLFTISPIEHIFFIEKGGYIPIIFLFLLFEIISFLIPISFSFFSFFSIISLFSFSFFNFSFFFLLVNKSSIFFLYFDKIGGVSLTLKGYSIKQQIVSNKE